jgi:hypothetical protein
MKSILTFVILVFSASTLFAQITSLPSNDIMIRQRLGASIAGLVIENTRLAVELDLARETIKHLQEELDKLKSKDKQ